MEKLSAASTRGLFAFLLSVLAVGCSGSGDGDGGSEGPAAPTLPDVFSAPSGSVSNAAAVEAVTVSERRAAPGLQVGGVQSGVGSVSAGLGLGLGGEAFGRAHASPSQIIVSRLRAWQESERGVARAGLGANLGDSACEEIMLLDAQITSAIQSKNGAIDVSIADLSTCAANITGAMTIKGNLVRDLLKIELNMTETLTDVCYRGNCVAGTFTSEYYSNLTAIEAVSLWDLTGSSSGTATGSTEGVIHANGSLTELTVEFGYFVEVDGQRRTFEAAVVATDDNQTYTIKGTDGEITCVVTSGAGACTGDATLSWDGS